MRLILDSTPTIETVNGVMARVWKGKTDSGIAVTAWIPIVQVHKDADQAAFLRELRELKVGCQLFSFDMRMVL